MKEEALLTAGIQKTTFGLRYESMRDLGEQIYHAAKFYGSEALAIKTLRHFSDSVKEKILSKTNAFVDAMVAKTNGDSTALQKLESRIELEIGCIASSHILQLTGKSERTRADKYSSVVDTYASKLAESETSQVKSRAPLVELF